MDELDIVKKFRKLKQDKSVLVGPGDDAAVIKIGNKYILFCGDMLIENVHFRLEQVSFSQIGYKAAARTLSDIAAMAGTPRYLGVSLCMPEKYRNKTDEILKGIKKLLRKFNISLVGGDLSKSPTIMLDTWCIGTADKNNYKLRNRAKANDAIFVSGRLGGSQKTGKHINFTPKIKLAKYLAKKFPINSMIDISDGLVLDLQRILSQSGKNAVIYQDNVPLNKTAKLKNALYDGEDYELLFTAPVKFKEKIMNTGCYFIGQIKTGKKRRVFLRNKDKLTELEIKGYLSI